MDSKVDETPVVSVKEEKVKIEGADESKPDVPTESVGQQQDTPSTEDVKMEGDVDKADELQQKIIRQIEVMAEKRVNILQWTQ